MKLSKRIASIALVAVLSVAGLAAITLAASDGHKWGPSAWAKHDKDKHHGGKHGDKYSCSRGGDGDSGHHRPDPNELAKKLTVMETEIGIRANQMDAWRDFTDALLATMAPPMKPGMGPGPKGPGPMPASDGEPFYLAEHFADRAIARGKSADELKQAIAQLRTTLTAEQLDKVKDIEARLRARIRAHHGPGPHGKDPHGMGPHGKGPHAGPPAPPAASDSGPDEPEASDDGDDSDEEDEDDSL